MEEVIINDRRVKFEDGEIWSYIKYGRSLNYKWCLIKGCKNSAGYHNMTINKKIYGKHRVMYKLHNPDWDMDDEPHKNPIDHIDRDKLNNNINNLRVVSPQQNAFNTNAKGYWCEKRYNTYRVCIMINGERKSYNVKTEDEAIKLRAELKIKYHTI